MNGAVNNVLVTRFSALGDVAIAVPVLYDVCRNNPQVRFCFVTRPLPASVFINPPANLEVVSVDLKLYPGVGGMRRLAGELKSKYAIDAYADLHDVLRTKLLRFFLCLAGVRTVRIDKDRKGRRRLTRRKGKVMRPLKASADRYRDTFVRLGLNGGNGCFTSLFDREASPSLFATASRPKAEGETWMAIAPFAQHKGKIYPLQLMEQVVAELASRPGYRLFLMGGGKEEAATFGRWRAKFGEQVVNMAEKRIGIPAELALLSHCNLMLSMDSANMHLASIVGLRVISVWGATHPYCGFMGWRQLGEDAVQLDMSCRPCSVYGNKPCRYGDYRCLGALRPADILGQIDAALQ